MENLRRTYSEQRLYNDILGFKREKDYSGTLRESGENLNKTWGEHGQNL